MLHVIIFHVSKDAFNFQRKQELEESQIFSLMIFITTRFIEVSDESAWDWFFGCLIFSLDFWIIKTWSDLFVEFVEQPAWAELKTTYVINRTFQGSFISPSSAILQVIYWSRFLRFLKFHLFEVSVELLPLLWIENSLKSN